MVCRADECEGCVDGVGSGGGGGGGGSSGRCGCDWKGNGCRYLTETVMALLRQTSASAEAAC